MSFNPEQFQNFADVLSFHAGERPDAEVIRHRVKDGEAPVVTRYGELHQQAQAIAAYLQFHLGPVTGERCLLMLPSGAEFAAAFFACFQVGAIAVPAFPPENNRQAYLDRLLGIIRDARPKVILGLSRDFERCREQLTAVLPKDGRLVAVDRVTPDYREALQVHRIGQDDLAFLQYTSGSTSAPKGVMVSHANLMANERSMAAGFGANDQDVWVNWLPLFHDMGLMAGLLLPILHGHAVHLMTPQFFLGRPARWLEAISQNCGTFSGGPDFAYRLCAERIRDEDIARLDLSNWRLAFTGSEPVRPDTLDRFARRFAPCGFRRESLAPSYGLAEATLFVCSHGFNGEPREFRFDQNQVQAGPAREAVRVSNLVGCGWVDDDHGIQLMDGETLTPVAEGEEGEIWVSGPSVAQGYWQNPEATAATFVERDGQRWVRTGDLGIAQSGNLFIAGREKDMIILNGQNIYPQDIEGILEREVELLRQGRIAAFATHDKDGAEGIGLALEIGRGVRKMVKPEIICATLAETLTEHLQLCPQLILLLEAGTLPRTTSGKLQRSACRSGWERRKLAVFAAWEQGHMLDQGGADSVGPGEHLVPEVVNAWREVLGQDELDEHSHFFALGGDSVALMEVVSRLNRVLAIELEPGALFERPRLGDFCTWVAARSRAPGRNAIPVGDDRAETLQSYAQKRLWFLDRLEGGSCAYHLSGEWCLQGQLNLQALQSSLDDLAVRHDNLRTVFTENDQQQPVQRVLEAKPVAIWQHDVSATDDAEAALAELNRGFVRQPMDLENGPLWHVHLVKVSDQDHRLLLIVHHLIADGWSAQVLVREFAAFYTAHVEKRAADLQALPIRYSDYAHWQREQLAGEEGRRQLAWWKQQLGDEQPVLELPADRPRPEVQSHRGARLSFAFPEVLSERLRALARARGVTLFMLMLALYKTQLYRYTGQRDLRVGVPVAGRGRPETEGLVGLFVNTLVLRSHPGSGQTFNELLEAVQAATLGAQSHAELPFEQLVEALQPERNLRHNPLCQVKFTQQFPLPDKVALPGLTLAMSQRDDDTAHFDLGLDITDRPDRIEAVLTYACDLFDRHRIQGFADDLVNLAEQVTTDPARKLGDLQLLAAPSELEGPQLVFPHRDVIALWRSHIDSSLSRQALQFEAESYDYGWLESESNRLAQALQSQGVGNGQPVAVCFDRSPEFVVALLAVLKAGGAFVPLDPKWPHQRKLLVLADCGSWLLLANDPVAGFDGQRLSLDATASWRSGLDRPPRVDIEPEQAAYVIYTSGTSGKPKGVVVSHGALANYVQGMLYTLKPSPSASMAMVSTVAADLGHTTLFGALSSGRTLHLLSPERMMDAESFARYMARHRVGVLKIVPAHLDGLLQADDPARVLPAEALVLGGEALPAGLVRRVRELAPSCRIFNHYGPSESTVGVLTNEIPGITNLNSAEAHLQGEILPLGMPFPNIRARVCSDEGLVLPQGGVGEIYLGGAGLALGYLGQPELTAEVFHTDPGRPGERWYASGDRGQLLEDGRLVFLGRGDDQVKIRGYRVSLGEIAQRIRTFEGVRDAHVQLDGHGQLMAWILAEGVDVSALRDYLGRHLPDYMVPAHLLPLAEFPLTANGKLDRRALPEPERQSSDYTPPLAGTETTLAELWQTLLKVERVGRHDNFFSLGGDSIVSLQVIARARKRGIKLTPKQLFEKQTIAELAEVAQLSEGQPAPAVVGSSPEVADFPLTPVQRRFFGLAGSRPQHWNQSVRLVAGEPLRAEVLRQALVAVVAAHPSLRLRFNPKDGTQGYRRTETSDLLWELDATSEADVQACFDDAQRSLSLHNGPLLRAVWVRLPQGRQELMITIHHLAVDGVSWRILLEDLQQGYEQALAGQAIELDTPSADFHHWSGWLQRKLAEGVFEPELDYWQKFTAEDAELPCDFPEGTARVGDGERLVQTLDAGLTRQLLTEAPGAYRTQVNDLLLAALARALHSWTGRDRIVITLEGHGRHGVGGAPDVSRTVGWFTTLYPVALEVEGDVLTTLKHTKEMLRKVPSEGLGYGVLKELKSPQHGSAATLEDLTGAGLTFNYLGRFDEAVKTGFTLCPGATGTNRDSSGPMANALVVDGLVRDGQLHLEWSYSRARFRRARIEQLMDAYRKALTELIQQCAAADGGLTPADVPLTSLDQDSLDTLTEAANIEDVLPLAPMQEGILLHSQLERGTGIYLMQDQYAVRSEIDFEAFRAAWQAVVQRHPVLRTGFRELGDRTYQVVHRQVDSPAQFIDLSHLSRDAALEKLDTLLARERFQGFDFTRPPLLRLRLVRFGDADYRIVQSHHHVLIDAWCRGLMLAEFFANYQGTLQGQAPSLPPARPYRDFIAWLAVQDEALARNFWRSELAGFTEVTPLPYQRSGTGENAGETAMADTSLSLAADESTRLAECARSLRLTVNTFMQAAWALLLMRHSGLDEVLFGVTVAGRPTELDGIEETLGLFINTLPLRVAVEGQGQTVLDFLSQLQSTNASMRQHEHLSLAEVQNLADTPRGDALFDSLFVFENVPMGPQVQAAARQYRITPLANRTHTNYPLTVVVLPGETYQLQFSYDARLFRETDMKVLLGQYRQLLRQLVTNPHRALAELQLVTDAERAGLEALGQGPRAEGWVLTSYLERFEAWVEAAPEREVARCRGQGMSYGELNRQANRLGHGLIAAGVQPDDVVALYAPRGLNLLAMIIGAFKAGGAYLALDERHPPTRSARMLQSSQAPVLLTPQACLDQVDEILAEAEVETGAMPVVLTMESLLASGHDSNPERYPDMDQLAYVIYTSGSTGEPKGVMVTQQGMLNNQLSKVPYLELGESDAIAQTAATGFDISVWQFLTAPLLGGRVEIIPDEVTHDPQRLVAAVASSGVTVLESVPAVIEAILSGPEQSLNRLRWMLPTGEALGRELARRWFERYDQVPLVNAYGPAECSDDVALHTLRGVDDTCRTIPIGIPTDNNRLYVLDSKLELVPRGVVGELYVGGTGVGRGYAGQPGLTAERFLPNPFGNPGERLYRTGDLARWNDEGVLEYAGRADFQVKIRGQRIEPGEIESCLLAIGGIRQAVVTAQSTPHGVQLVGYLVPERTPEDHSVLDTDAVKARLAAELPATMVPTHFLMLDQLPLNANGKLDRKRLPKPQVQEQQVEPPETELEQALAGLWQDLLQVAQVGRNQHFFELGGHSLLATRLLSRIHDTFGVSVPLAQAFEATTVAAMAKVIEGLQGRSLDRGRLDSLDALMSELEEME